MPASGTIIVEQDDDGNFHFATSDRPERITVDVHGMCIGFGGWLKLDTTRKTITVSLDGEILIYHRIGKDLHGWWVCDRIVE